jgi:hypothetical protein
VAGAIVADVGLTPCEAARLRDLPAAHLLVVQERATPRGLGLSYAPYEEERRIWVAQAAGGDVGKLG